MKTIVVGYDGTDAAERALARAVEFARTFSSNLVVVSVAVPPPITSFEPPSPMFGPVAPVPPAMPAEETADPAEPARRLLARARAAVRDQGVEAEFVAEAGDPAEVLLNVAERHDADLIVLGSHEHGFLDRLLGGGVEEALERRADRDLLLVR